ncbi:uncharacterized protein LOC107605247 isoform X5 [Arachis ipaensis]|uniref:uncharacterized protein LOC107605247 isoform X5 n=1 Tax=Arachis ipaensis TaxID=130454 RepID=UPI000A2B68DC|nr:uncharacterized protein LOC107605247 isoform X5 [Arachis ipaensis]
MAMASWNSSLGSYQKQTMAFEISCRKRDRERDRERGSIHPYKVVEITPPPKCLGVRCLPPFLQKKKSCAVQNYFRSRVDSYVLS